MDFELLNVGIADVVVSQSPNILRTILGSCVGICIYDPIRKVGGLAHIMLPTKNTRSTSITKYADTAIPYMINEMVKQDVDKKNLIAKISGGAAMFKVGESSIMGEIGKNNIIKVKSILNDLDIPLRSDDVGGDFGRTIDFYLENGSLHIKSLGRKEIVI